jgi:hypothetical protein
MAEIGFAPSQVVARFVAFLVPKRTPRSVVDRLHAGIAKALADPEVKAAIERLGNVALPPDTTQSVDQMLASEFERWQKFIAETGLALEPEQNWSWRRSRVGPWVVAHYILCEAHAGLLSVSSTNR